MRLAGTYHPIPYLLERLSQYLPGIVEKSALWLDYDRELYSTNDAAPIYNELKVKAQIIRNTTATHEWDSHSGLFTNKLSAPVTFIVFKRDVQLKPGVSLLKSAREYLLYVFLGLRISTLLI